MNADVADIQAVFRTEPASGKVEVGGTIRLDCEISGIPPLEAQSSVQWSQNNFALGFAPQLALRDERYLEKNSKHFEEIKKKSLKKLED